MNNIDKIIGVSKNLLEGVVNIPINGLRHMESENSKGWYLWSGEYSDSEDFFHPVHQSHLVDKYPFLEKYLQLPPGFRFLVDENGYEDIWSDDSLLDF